VKNRGFCSSSLLHTVAVAACVCARMRVRASVPACHLSRRSPLLEHTEICEARFDARISKQRRNRLALRQVAHETLLNQRLHHLHALLRDLVRIVRLQARGCHGARRRAGGTAGGHHACTPTTANHQGPGHATRCNATQRQQHHHRRAARSSEQPSK